MPNLISIFLVKQWKHRTEMIFPVSLHSKLLEMKECWMSTRCSRTLVFDKKDNHCSEGYALAVLFSLLTFRFDIEMGAYKFNGQEVFHTLLLLR